MTTQEGEVVLRGIGLEKRYPNGVVALSDVDIELRRGEILGLVGESGCGKSTLSKVLLQLSKATAGSVLFDGSDLCVMKPHQLQAIRHRIQFVPQNPTLSLNPRAPVAKSVRFNLTVNGWSRRDADARVRDLLDMVGIAEVHAKRYPHELSGGQIQRIAIARALATSPEVVICDEAVSALDKSVQAQVLNLIAKLQAELDVAFLFVSHDLSVVSHIADRVCVMYLGRIVEEGSVDDVMTHPLHPYARGLMNSVPGRGAMWRPLRGEPPSPTNPPSGCPFRLRCDEAIDACASYDHRPVRFERGRSVSCLRHSLGPDEGSAAGLERELAQAALEAT